MNIRPIKWTTECPSKPGIYMHKCNETDFEVEKLRVFSDRGFLWADTDCGIHEISYYHNGVTSPEWALFLESMQ